MSVVRITRCRTLAQGQNDLGGWATVTVQFDKPHATLYAATIAAARDEALRVGRLVVGDPVGQDVSTGLTGHDDFWQMNMRVQGFLLGHAPQLGSEQIRDADVVIVETEFASATPSTGGKTRRIRLDD